ncbi:Minor tail protein OS=Streptomyces fumanus OX=67302 GN=GCM10018772_44610 PE=4 SV=1 [Streptomyces fumanus]
MSYPAQLGGIAPTGRISTGSYVGQYRDNNGRLERWNGTAWTPAMPSPVFAYNNAGGYCKTTTWSEALTGTTGPTVTATFTAPISGSVLVTVGFQGQPSVEGGWGRMSVNIRKGGVLVTGLGAAETRSAIVTNRGNQSVTTTFPVTGLTAGATYTAVSAYSSSATTNNHWFDNRFVRVDPML